MGYNNVQRVLLAYPPLTNPLPPRTLHCLLLMAARAHDKTGLYFAGIDWLTMQLGYPANEGGRRNTLRHIARLEKHGYVSHTGDRRGRKLVYHLHLPTLLGPVDNP